MNNYENLRIHNTAEVSAGAVIGAGTSIWNNVQVRKGAEIGKETIIGKNTYVDSYVEIGSRCKIQNNVSIFHGVKIADGVFVGPHVCFTNDKLPRAINPDGSLKDASDWQVTETSVKYGAAIGANSVILPGVILGRFCMIASGSVVTKNVPDNGLVMGNPARLAGWVCDCGERLEIESGKGTCKTCGREILVREGE